MLAEIDQKGHQIAKYVYGLKIISQVREGQTSYYGFDGLDNVRFLMDGQGNKTDTYTYDAFGNLIKKTGNTINNYLYCGEQYDANTGFYYLRARYMEPSTGRFITMDDYTGNIFEPASLHRYAYVNSNPVNAEDPSGHFIAGLMNCIQSGIQTLSAMALYKKIVVGVRVFCFVYETTNSIFELINGTMTPQEFAMQVVFGVIAVGASFAFGECVAFKKAMLGIGAIFGISGIIDAWQNKRYDLVLIRTVDTALTFIDLFASKCFTGDTLIATADGEEPIAEIEVGDYVWAEDVETGEKALKQVEEVFVKETSTLVHVTVRDQVINTTETHLFYVEGKGWIEAIDLEEGDLLSLLDGTTEKVEKVEREYLDEPVKVYNFTVEDYHTYYVGKINILVHNTYDSSKPIDRNNIPEADDLPKLPKGGDSEVASTNRVYDRLCRMFGQPTEDPTGLPIERKNQHVEAIWEFADDVVLKLENHPRDLGAPPVHRGLQYHIEISGSHGKGFKGTGINVK